MKANILLVILSAAFLLTACQEPASEPQFSLESVQRTDGELIHNPDLFLSNFSSSNTTVLGVSIGMTEREVMEKLGAADHIDEFNFGAIRNLHYGPKLGLNGTAVLYHIEHGFVTRIAVGPMMNPLLSGTTEVNKTKADVYGLFGTPDRQYDIKQGRFFVYNKQGFEVYMGKGTELQYAFVYPGRKLDTTAVFNKTKNQYEVLRYETPRLITDTTTLCDQGKTFGYSAARKECRAFNSSCEIPSTWIEVDTCEAGPSPAIGANTTNSTGGAQ